MVSAALERMSFAERLTPATRELPHNSAEDRGLIRSTFCSRVKWAKCLFTIIHSCGGQS